MTTITKTDRKASLHPSIVALVVVSDLIKEADGIAFLMSRLTGTLTALALETNNRAMVATCEALSSEVRALFGAVVDADTRANTGIIMEPDDE